MIKLIIKGGTVILTAPATWPAAAVLAAGVVAVGATAYGIHKLSQYTGSTKKILSYGS